MAELDHLRDELIERARGGDLDALNALLEGLPGRLPGATVRAWRASIIRRLFAVLKGNAPERSDSRCIDILSAIGSGKSDDRTARLLDHLTDSERAEIRAQVLAIQKVATWPAETQIREIVKVVGNTPVVSDRFFGA